MDNDLGALREPAGLNAAWLTPIFWHTSSTDVPLSACSREKRMDTRWNSASTRTLNQCRVTVLKGILMTDDRSKQPQQGQHQPQNPQHQPAQNQQRAGQGQHPRPDQQGDKKQDPNDPNKRFERDRKGQDQDQNQNEKNKDRSAAE